MRHCAVRRDRKTSIDTMALHLSRCALAVAMCASIAELGHAQAARTTRDDRTTLYPSERMTELDIVGLRLNTSLRELMAHATVEAPVKDELESLGRATGWLNSGPLAAADLRGNVVLV
jgi:hypothetical protein